MYIGPKVSSSGLVASFDASSFRGFRGEPIKNLYYFDASSSANNDLWSMPMGGTATGTYSVDSTAGKWNNNTIWKVTVSSGTLVGYESWRRCVPASFDSTYGTTRRISCKVKMIKGSISALSIHNGGGTGGHSISNFTSIIPDAVPRDVTDNSGWYQMDADVSGNYSLGHCVGVGIVTSDIIFLTTEMMLYPSSKFLPFTPTERGTNFANDGGWIDMSGKSNHGTLTNGPTYSSLNSGILEFDGTNDYVTTSSSSNFAFGTGDFTLECWIYPQSFSTYTHMIALPDQNTFALKANVTDGAIYFYSPTYTTYGDTSGWTLSINTWNHVIFKRESQVGYAFLNGVSKGSKSGFSNNFSSQVLNIHNGWPGEFTQCKIGCVRIYNRALSSQEISDHFSSHKTRFGL